MAEDGIEKYLKRLFPFILGIPLFLLLVFSIVQFASDESTFGSNPFNEQSTELSSIVEYEMSALSLIDEFFESQSIARSTYSDVLVQVSGEVREVGRNTEDKFYIFMYGHFSWDGLRCVFDDPEFSTRISRGEKIEVVGRVQGLMRNIVVLHECRIV